MSKLYNAHRLGGLQKWLVYIIYSVMFFSAGLTGVHISLCESISNSIKRKNLCLLSYCMNE